VTQGVQVDPMTILTDDSSSLARIIAAVAEAEASAAVTRNVSVGVSSNATVDLLGVFLRRHALPNGVRLTVHQGNHDDAIGDVETFIRKGVEYLVLLPVFDNLLPSLEAQLGHLDPAVVAAKEAELCARYRLVFEKAQGCRGVAVCDFHRLTSSDGSAPGHGVGVIAAFNAAIRAEAAAFPNVRVIDTGEIVSDVGRKHAFDLRYYFRGKAPYSTAFLDRLARRLGAVWRGFGAYFYKAIALDCDNTLWGGIVGEDLLDGIKLDPFDYPGNVFWRLQNELVSLERNGVLICLCTRNNAADVDEVLERHPAAVLKKHHIVLAKVNWSDKVTNLRQIAAELGIGLDSIVFLDDSPFECAAVRSQLPMVRTFQIPEELAELPRVITEIKELFLAGGITAESRTKTEQYRQRARGGDLAASFDSHEAFLASLGLKVEVARDAKGSIPRISELTMKSNQFNLTTPRYGTTEVQQLMEDAGSTVYSMTVSDKFGSAGITGVLVMRWESSRAVVDSFLMSCRVIGRGVEFAIWNEVRRDALKRGCETLYGEYFPTAKNAQVADFFDRLGLPCVGANDGVRRYEMAIASFTPPAHPWIEVSCA
jgi:FkbH-like protein